MIRIHMKASQVTTFIAALLTLGMFAGCPSAPEETTTTKPGTSPDTIESRAQPEPEGEPVTITITGNDTMRFDTTEFTVKPRQPVTILFKNVGTIPKESMGHNVVVLQQGVDPIDYANAAARHVQNEYRDPAREDEVIAATRILGPGEEEEISFTAPEETGDYDYLCSFPGHAQSGMVGVMKVE